jgi:hypothetical protein
MRLIEEANEDLKGVLPRTYARLETRTLVEVLKLMASIPTDIEGDAFGKIYEYFLGKFAMAEGQKGGEFFTPTALVKLIVEIIEPYHGRIYDPACGSGGMPRPHLRSGLRLGRHVRAVRPLRRGAQEGPWPRDQHLWPGAGREHGAPVQHELGRARARRRHPRGQQLLRGPARRPAASTTSWPIRRST